jgi:hypothetical protein
MSDSTVPVDRSNQTRGGSIRSTAMYGGGMLARQLRGRTDGDGLAWTSAASSAAWLGHRYGFSPLGILGNVRSFVQEISVKVRFAFAYIENEASTARSATLLGRAERSSRNAAQRRRQARGLDGEGADRRCRVGCSHYRAPGSSPNWMANWPVAAVHSIAGRQRKPAFLIEG